MMNLPSRSDTRIQPMLAVSNGSAAIDFYKAAFGAEELWRIGDGEAVVAGLSVNGADFFLAKQSPAYGTRSPDAVGATTVRIELFVDDPQAMLARAVAAGARELDPVREHHDKTRGPRPISRMLQGAIVDPFGHMWLIGRILE